MKGAGCASSLEHPGIQKDGLPAGAGDHSRMQYAGGREGSRGMLEQLGNWVNRGEIQQAVVAGGGNAHRPLKLKTCWHKASPKGLIHCNMTQ